MYKRTTQKELSFAGEKLIRGRHKLHPYPAMLHPLLVDHLINKYAKKGDVIFDPFCGSGVTLLQSSLKGFPSIGFEINPLALLIARAKTASYNIAKLKEEFTDFKKKVSKNEKIDIPAIKNIDYWYTKNVIRDLGRVRFVLKKHDYEYKDFFIVAFALICRKQSLTRNGEFKRYRVKEGQAKASADQVFGTLFKHLEEMIEVFENSDFPQKNTKPILANSENPISPSITYDLVITSPPYGDSRTTVAYGEYSSFGSEWTNDLHSYGAAKYRVDSEGLGKVGALNKELKDHKILTSTLKKIAALDEKRANEVRNFYNGYYNVVRNVVANLAEGGRVCFVVGNRTVKGTQIPMDQITASFFESMGLKYEGIFVRDILNKIMPSQNSPSNKAGVKLQTMVNEYIVIFKK